MLSLAVCPLASAFRTTGLLGVPLRHLCLEPCGIGRDIQLLSPSSRYTDLDEHRSHRYGAARRRSLWRLAQYGRGAGSAPRSPCCRTPPGWSNVAQGLRSPPSAGPPASRVPIVAVADADPMRAWSRSSFAC